MWTNVLLISMTAISMLFVKITWAHMPAHAKPDIQETDEPVMVRRGIVNQLKPWLNLYII